MIRFTWLQSRTQTLVAAFVLAALAVVAAITGIQLSHLYATLVAHCRTGCDLATSQYLSHDQVMARALDLIAQAAPALIGLFWGAPLVARELESGTFRLAWTQGVTRTRWLVTKLAVAGAASAAAAGLLSLLVTWWSSPFDKLQANRFSPGWFDQRGLVPIGYAAFAFALGVTAGVLIRRTLPAMASTVVAFVAARLALTEWVRPHLAAPARLAVALDPGRTGFGSTGSGPETLQPDPPRLADAWVYSTQVLDKAGHALTNAFLTKTCPSIGGPAVVNEGSGRTQVPVDKQHALQDCVARVSAVYHEVVTYQPASRYWRFQWYETGLYLALAVALAGLCVWWVRRRLT